jgi:Predicted ATP-dependent serine protease
MTSNFTTGIPEIDRITGSKVRNGSFILISGNDDEGMSAFLAEIEKSNGRPAEKEKQNRKSFELIKFDSKNQINLDEILSFSEKNRIFIIEDLSEFYSGENSDEGTDERANEKQSIQPSNIQNEEIKLIRLIRKIKTIEKQKDEKTKTGEIKSEESFEENSRIYIGCLYENILTASTENRIKHLADSHFQFRMIESGNVFERTILIHKNKDGFAGGKILKYVIERGKIQIENKKRIY